jgi:hypothetical protein
VTETQTVDLASWLTAIWDEEERWAREAATEHAIDHDHLGWASIDWNGIENERLGQLCAPMYALARIAADRKILELHGVAWNAEVCTVCHHPHEDGETLDNDAWPCATVRLLASPYKGREGWQEAWAHE